MTMSPEMNYDLLFDSPTTSSSDIETIPQKDNSLQLSISLAIEQLLSENRKQKFYTSVKNDLQFQLNSKNFYFRISQSNRQLHKNRKLNVNHCDYLPRFSRTKRNLSH